MERGAYWLESYSEMHYDVGPFGSEGFEKSVCDWKSVPMHNDRCNLQRNIIIANSIPIYVVSWSVDVISYRAYF